VIKISFGCTRDFRVKIWGTSLPEEKLAGDLGNVIEATPNHQSSVRFFYSRQIGSEQFGTFSTASVIPVISANGTSLLRPCAVIRRRFPVGASPTRQPLQPEATGAAMEVTKWLKPSGSVSRIGDSASVQAVTRVNAEQTSKRTMRRPTRLGFRGRLIRLGVNERRSTPSRCAGVVATACTQGKRTQHGKPHGVVGARPTGSPRGTGQAPWGGGEVRSTAEAG
jgi:hypothetical protein